MASWFSFIFGKGQGMFSHFMIEAETERETYIIRSTTIQNI